MALYKHTNGNLLKAAGGLAKSGDCCCGAGYCCTNIGGNMDCVDLSATLTCAQCVQSGGVCHTQTDCKCSTGSGAAGTGGSYCAGTGMGTTLV